MITLDILADNLDALAAAAARAADGTAQREPISRVGDRYVQRLRDETPVGQGESPGRLRRAYLTSETYVGGQAEYAIRNDAPYLRWVLNGRGRVTAKRAKALRFVINGRVLFRRSVGPVKPNRFDQRVRDAMDGELSALPDEIAAALIRVWNGGTP